MVVGGCRSFLLLVTTTIVTTIVIHVDLPLKSQSFFKGSEFSLSELSR